MKSLTCVMNSCSGVSEYTETLHGNGMISVLFTSLSDSEGYVQASAVTAIGEAVTTPGIRSDVQVKQLITSFIYTVFVFIRYVILTFFSFLLFFSFSGKSCDAFVERSL